MNIKVRKQVYFGNENESEGLTQSLSYNRKESRGTFERRKLECNHLLLKLPTSLPTNLWRREEL
jgi:hypothetical protein